MCYTVSKETFDKIMRREERVGAYLVRLHTQQLSEQETQTSARILNRLSNVEPLEDVIDDLTQQLKVNHIQRLQHGRCTLELGFIYNDCINNFERVADHCSNIAVAVWSRRMPIFCPLTRQSL